MRQSNLKNTKFTMKLSKIKAVAAFGGLLLAHQTLEAATATWNQATAGSLWSVPGNWSGSTPAGNDVLFSGIGTTASSTTVGNILDGNISISSLTYYYNSPSWTVTQINSGVTLTVTGAASGATILDVGSTGGANPTTQAVFLGGGKLYVNQSDANMNVSGRTNGTANATGLDLSGLASFEATLDTISLALGKSVNAGYTGTLKLAVENKITATNLFIGKAGGAQTVSAQSKGNVILGTTNDLFVNHITVGGDRGLGTLAFADDLENASVVIRGKDSTVESPTRTVLDVGISTTGGATAYGGTADFTGGSIDAYLSTLRIGVLTTNNPLSPSSSFLMDSGTVDAQSVVIGQKTDSGTSTTGTVSGSLDVGGGTLTTGTLSMAQQAGSVGSTVATLKVHGTGEVSVTGGGILMGTEGTTSATVSIAETGKLTVAGNIAKGTGTTNAALSLSGGTLEMNGHSVAVDTFTAASGTLRNLAELNSGGAFTKSTTGTLVVEGTNAWSGDTVINAGTLLINGTHTGGGYTVNSGGTLGGTGTITTQDDAGITLAAGGKLAPGNSPGTLALDLGAGTLDLSAGIAATHSQALIFELGSFSDKITLTGSLNIGLGALEFDDFVFQGIDGFAAGQYTLFDTNSTISGTLGSSLIGVVNGFQATLAFANGGQDLVLNVAPIPEPAGLTTLAMALGVGALLWRKHRVQG